MASQRELDAMGRALVLSGRALGRTSPNPPVGAVVLDAAGALVGEGWTQPPGGPHAEVEALAAAGERAAGGTVIVTLEPCAHTGRTGPCTRALTDAGVARVVVACPDPTELAAGGVDVLREAGVDVESGVMADEVGRGPLEAWLHRQRTGRPFVTWKYAATLDGRSAAADGSSRWITSEPARADVHRLRGESDVVMAGVGTVLQDDPLLDARPDLHARSGPPSGHQPLRVVVDSQGRTPATARCLRGPHPALVVTTTPVQDYPRNLVVGADDHGQVDLAQLLTSLGGVTSVLLEGGPTLAGAFVRAGLVDRIVGYVAPALLGDGRHALGPAGAGTISAAHRFRLDDVTRIGDDVRLTLRPAHDDPAMFDPAPSDPEQWRP